MLIRTLIISVALAIPAIAQNSSTIDLNPPDTSRNASIMKAFALRASSSDFDTTDLKLQDVSDLLWAANGVNRPESGKRTAPSARNAQDIDIYVFFKSGVFLYDAKNHVLNLLKEGDYRVLVAGRQENFSKAPLLCLLVSDISKFSSKSDSLKMIWAAEDAGIVSQNISLFCASAALATRPRATMEQEKLRAILKLKNTQYIMLNNPVSYQHK